MITFAKADARTGKCNALCRKMLNPGSAFAGDMHIYAIRGLKDSNRSNDLFLANLFYQYQQRSAIRHEIMDALDKNGMNNAFLWRIIANDNADLSYRKNAVDALGKNKRGILEILKNMNRYKNASIQKSMQRVILITYFVMVNLFYFYQL